MVDFCSGGCYFITIMVYGIDFGVRASKFAPISDTIRSGDTEWNSDGLASLGYSYW